jgi:hypothetical protein
LTNELGDYEPVNVCPGLGPSAFVIASRKLRHYQALTGDFLVVEAGPDFRTRHEFTKRDKLIHYAQSLVAGGMILVAAGCRQEEKNAWLFDHEDRCIGQICLGHGIEDVQVTQKGEIWTSYFDEGVFAAPGWNHGASGLVCWSMSGEKKWEFKPRDGLDIICDCYALNVVADREVWFYYYTEFPLVRLTDQCELTWWKCPVRGAHVFAIWSDWALFGHPYKGAPQFTLLRLEEKRKMAPQLRVRFLDDQGKDMSKALSSARGPILFFLREGNLYSVDIRLFIP